MMFVLPVQTSWAAASDRTIIVGYDENSFPAYFQEERKWVGMDVEVIRRLIQGAGLTYHPVSMKFPRLHKDLRMGVVHLVPNLTKTAKRSEDMEWIGPVRTTAIALLCRPERLSITIETYDDLERAVRDTQLRIAYVTATSFSESFERRLADEAFVRSLFFVSEKATAARMTKAGRVLGFFYDDLEAAAIMQQPEMAKLEGFDGLAIHDFRIPGSEGGVYIGMSKRLPDAVRTALQQEFQTIQQNGELDAIISRWTEADNAANAADQSSILNPSSSQR
ncbi:ABC-type amino acid transport substrate-binding protein [Kordiimonas lacus]|uniref:ABC-type amino acid transport substrate-binding protein n=1 Tax=Kordiimonas lacus TaxID=637679 RepID=A0A1G6YGS8_9PROT|nr:ABC-type amino acid transport substrate-binding protein [Kordiimonas lacus]